MPSMMSRKDILLSLLNKRPAERVPVTTYGVDRFSHPWMAQEPSYSEVLVHSDRLDYIFAIHRSYYASFGFTDILSVDETRFEKKVTTDEEETSFEFTLHTPKGPLSARAKERKNLRTVWRYEYLMKDGKDIDAFLATPFRPRIPPEEEFDQLVKELGEKGLPEIELPNAVCLVVENMPYKDFMMLPLTDATRLERLLDKASSLLLEWTEGMLKKGFGPVYRIFGAEYAIPPYMSPDMFKRFVVKYDRPLINLIHRKGCYVRYHCHGPLRRILPDLLSLEIDMLDPCEGPPNGDISLKEVARILGKDVILIGNIQLDDIERASVQRIDRLVKEAIDEVGDKAPLIIAPTAHPMEIPLSATAARNIVQLLQSAWEYG